MRGTAVLFVAFAALIASLAPAPASETDCTDPGDSLLGEHRITEGMELHAAHPVGYTLDVDTAHERVTLRGPLQIGVAAALERVLAEHPCTRELVLDSDGGNVYQARALAALVLAHRLDTHVLDRCHSACTTVYVAGARRRLGDGASLGFHCYRLAPDALARPGIDPAAEQRRDLAFFAERIPDASFVERIFRCASPGLWLPAPTELLASGVAHEIMSD